MNDLTVNYGTLVAGCAAVASAMFAAATWHLSRSQFRLFWPFVDVNYRRLLNGHLIEFTKEGQQRAEWEITQVSVRGGKSILARYRTLSFPDGAIGWAGSIIPIGRDLDTPSNSFLIVNEEDPLKATLTFSFRAKSRAKLRHRIRHVVHLQPLPSGLERDGKSAKPFSGTVEITF